MVKSNKQKEIEKLIDKTHLELQRLHNKLAVLLYDHAKENLEDKEWKY